MIKVIAVLVSVIFFFGFGDEFAFALKKMTIIKVHQGLPPSTTFTKRLTHNED